MLGISAIVRRSLMYCIHTQHTWKFLEHFKFALRMYWNVQLTKDQYYQGRVDRGTARWINACCFCASWWALWFASLRLVMIVSFSQWAFCPANTPSFICVFQHRLGVPNNPFTLLPLSYCLNNDDWRTHDRSLFNTLFLLIDDMMNEARCNPQR